MATDEPGGFHTYSTWELPLADEAQLGGAVIVTPGGKVPWAPISEDASDMAAPAETLAELRSNSA